MFVATIYKYAGSAAIDCIVGGFASHKEAFAWCARNVPRQPFHINEVEHVERRVATVNGYGIRPVGSRFGRLFIVEGTKHAFRSQAEAEAFAKTQPPRH